MNLDITLLRSLILAVDLGGFGRAAERVGRTQSALSLQMRKLEEQAGQPLFRKQGRVLALTETGTMLLGYARRLLELNDEAVIALRGRAIAGEVRLGLPADFAENALPMILARFARAYPALRIDARVGRNAGLIDRLSRKELDLALAFNTSGTESLPDRTRIDDIPMAWIGPLDWIPPEDGPLPLVLFEQPCLFSKAALDALDRIGRSWRITFTSPSLSGLWAATTAGLGATVRTASYLPKGLRVLDSADGLPPLPSVALSLHTVADASETVRALQAILLESLLVSLSDRAG
jgi:DNA-binding transcriptional LysR family regulator